MKHRNDVTPVMAFNRQTGLNSNVASSLFRALADSSCQQLMLSFDGAADGFLSIAEMVSMQGDQRAATVSKEMSHAIAAARDELQKKLIELALKASGVEADGLEFGKAARLTTITASAIDAA